MPGPAPTMAMVGTFSAPSCLGGELTEKSNGPSPGCCPIGSDGHDGGSDVGSARVDEGAEVCGHGCLVADGAGVGHGGGAAQRQHTLVVLQPLVDAHLARQRRLGLV